MSNIVDSFSEEMSEVPKFMQRTYIDYKYLREFGNDDFNINSRTFIDLLYCEDDEKLKEITKDNLRPYFILFMADSNKASKNYLNVWLQLAQEIKDDKCYLGFCNLDYEIAVKGVFKLLSDQPDHPYFWARFLEVPFMMVYRDGFPQGFYNGSIDLKSLTEFCTDYVSLKGAQIDKRHLLRSENLDSMYLRQAKLAQLQNLSLPDINEYTSIETEEDPKKRVELTYKREEKGKVKKSYKNQLIAPSIEY